MGIPNLARCGRPGQEWQSRCNLASSKIAISVGYHGLWSTSSPHHIGCDQPNYPTTELPLGMSLEGGFLPVRWRIWRVEIGHSAQGRVWPGADWQVSGRNGGKRTF